MVSDARSNTKVYLDTYLDSAELTDDEGAPVIWKVAYANPDYPLVNVFWGKLVDLLFSVGEPDSRPLMNFDMIPYGYEEHVPISIECVDKPFVTGEKLKWKGEAELRRIVETYPAGSLRSLSGRRSDDRELGSARLYSTRVTLNYRRGIT